VAKVAPPRPFSSAVSVGTRLPAHATVFGHVLLSDLGLAALQALYPEDRLESYTASTPARVAELHRMTQAVRERGHVVGRGFFEAHIATVGAPVRDAAGQVVAALGLTVPSDLLDEPAAGALVERVRAAAAELSSLLDHQAPAAEGRVVPLRRGAA
jgi:DNA-binding IclR family transcriptional regulator